MATLLLTITLLQVIDGSTMLKFDPGQVVQIHGEIIAIQEANWYAPFDANLVADIQTEQGERILMDLGAQSEYKKPPKPGQQLEASGMLTSIGEKTYFLTQEIQIGKQHVVLRDSSGTPRLMKTRDKKTFFHRMNRMRRMRKMR